MVLEVNGLRDLRCIYDNDCIRLVFQWREGAEFVHVYRHGVGEENTAQEDFFPENARLLTLQEYKRRGGFIIQKEHGIFNFIVECQGQRESIQCKTGETLVQIHTRKKWQFGAFTRHEITLFSDFPTPANILCYEKIPFGGLLKISEKPIVYNFTEALTSEPLTRHILTNKFERLNIYVKEEKNKNLYQVVFIDTTPRRQIWDFLRKK